MKKIFAWIFVAVLSVFSLSSFIDNTTYATNTTKDACDYMKGSAICQKTPEAKSIVPNVIRILAWVVGVLSVIMIIWAGIQYVISSGDSGKIGKAKNTLIYAVVGLVIAISAGAIVSYILNKA
ncbi:MAG: hypothetical protein Q4A21_03505 [bacterium]|nr:hypothetical protein [bacterium]